MTPIVSQSRARFDEVLATGIGGGWRTARGRAQCKSATRWIETGVRQLIRDVPLEHGRPAARLIVSTEAELLRARPP
jgi:hypothetical protein